MPTMDRSRTLRVTAFGKRLQGPCDLRADWGRVAAVFQRSCHVLGADGRVTCIVDRQLGNGPVNICVELPDGLAMEDLDVEPGTPLRRARGHLYLGGRTALDLSGAERWTPPPIGPRAGAVEVRRRARTLCAALGPSIPNEGLAPMALLAEGLAWGLPCPQTSLTIEPEPTTLVTAAALPSVRGLVRGLLTLDAPLVDVSAAGLIGLGPGLTPSGDDFLAGLMVAMMSGGADAAASLAGRQASVLGNSVASLAPDRTTSLSATLLTHAAEGAGSEAAHLLLAAILGARGQPDPGGAARSLAGGGHTSGWDTLAGLLLGIHLVLRLGDSGGVGALREAPLQEREVAS